MSAAKGGVVFWAAVAFLFLAMILAIGGFATPGWYTAKDELFNVKFQKSIGLWSCILVVGGHTTTGQLSVNGEFTPFFEATRALSAVGTILLVIAFIGAFVFCCTTHKRITSAIVSLCVTLGGIILLVAIGLFAGYIHHYYDKDLSLASNTYLDYSYYMQVVAGALAIIAAIMFCAAGGMSQAQPSRDW